MQRNISNKQNISFRSHGKTVAHYCILLVFGITFFLQQVQAFFVSHNRESTNSSKSILVSPKQTIRIPYSSVHEIQLAPETMDMELEIAEEDETSNSEDELFNKLAQKYALEELEYACLLRSLYLHLSSSVHKQPLVPFFILYHSWKEDIIYSTIS